MPEIKAIKSKPTVNAFDFNFFADNKVSTVDYKR